VKVVVFGAGYVGFSTSVLFAQEYPTTVVDVSQEKVETINAGGCPFVDKDYERYRLKACTQLEATQDIDVVDDAAYACIAIPSDYCETLNAYDTSDIKELVLEISQRNQDAVIVIRSTVGVGFTEQISELVENEVVYCPEFLREGSAVRDTFSPDRIVIGGDMDTARRLAESMRSCLDLRTTPVLYATYAEAEAVKLFANAYLAMRVAFFNELDSFALHHDLDAKKIIDGVCLDPRIEQHYNNPSFGFGGYCLPKDTQVLSKVTGLTYGMLIDSITQSNDARKQLIAERIKQLGPKTIGIYRLCMKRGSDNFREAAIIDILRFLHDNGESLVIFEPLASEDTYEGVPVIKDFIRFCDMSDVILANRVDDRIKPFADKVFTRDVFQRD